MDVPQMQKNLHIPLWFDRCWNMRLRLGTLTVQKTSINWKWFSAVLHGLPNLIIVAQPLLSKLLDDLGWSTLSDRRKESRLSMFGKAVAGRVSISVDKFSKSTKFTHFSDASTFTTISARTDPYKYSFFPRTICDWNSLSAQSRLQLVPGLSC